MTPPRRPDGDPEVQRLGRWHRQRGSRRLQRGLWLLLCAVALLAVALLISRLW